MSRLRPSVCAVVLFLPFAGILPMNHVQAQDIDAMLNAPSWDLAYEMVFESSDSGKEPTLHGSIAYTRTVEFGFTSKFTLDMRNAGASLSMMKMAMGGNLTTEEAQQKSLELIMRTESIANWMSAGPSPDENASDEAQMLTVMDYMYSSKGSGRLDHKMVVTGIDLVDETGAKYNSTTTTTMRGAGPVHGPTQVTFEIDSETLKYLLTLSHSCGDQSDSTVVEEVVTVWAYHGQDPTGERAVRYSGLCGFPPGLKLDDPTSLLGEVPFFEGDVDPKAGKITGERTLKGHYTDRATEIPGTFVFRWTVTPRL